MTDKNLQLSLENTSNQKDKSSTLEFHLTVSYTKGTSGQRKNFLIALEGNLKNRFNEYTELLHGQGLTNYRILLKPLRKDFLMIIPRPKDHTQ